MKVIFIDIDNTLLSFSEYVKHTMQTGFEHFGLKHYEPYMYDIFTEENNKLWRRIEQGTLVFSELEKVRWNIIFARLGIGFDGTVFEKYFRRALYDSAIPMPYSDERYAKIVYAYDVNFSRAVVSDALDRSKSKSALFERDGKGDSRTTSSISPHTGRMNFFEKSAVGERKFKKNAESMIMIRLL